MEKLNKIYQSLLALMNKWFLELTSVNSIYHFVIAYGVMSIVWKVYILQDVGLFISTIAASLIVILMSLIKEIYLKIKYGCFKYYDLASVILGVLFYDLIIVIILIFI